MGLISLTDATPLTEIQSSLFNNNNAVLEGEINGGLEDVNFAAAADLAVSKLANGSDGQFLKTVGTTPTWAAFPTIPMRVLSQSGTQIDVVNTAVETDILSYSLAGNTLGSHGSLRLTLLCDYLNNTGSNRTLTVKVKLGATTMWGDANTAIATNAARRMVQISLMLGNMAATNAQIMQGYYTLTSVTAGGFGGIGDLDAPVNPGAFMGTATEDTTAAKTLAVTVTHSVADANLSLRMRYAVLELLTI